MMKPFTVATRGTQLAIAQTQIVTGLLKKIYPDIKIKIKKIATAGDKDKKTALWNLKSTGFFTSQVENALLAQDADFAVHSFKDLPTNQPQGLTIAAVCDRQFPDDCLVAGQQVTSLDKLAKSATIGTSSLRRSAQVKNLRPDLIPTTIRGNVPTRIKAFEEAKFDAVILARAGLERLALENKISFSFNPEKFIPAPAQGALALQTRTDDTETNKLLAAIDNKNARLTTFTERQILITTKCGCHGPVGAFAKVLGNNIQIFAFISDLEGVNFIKRQITGPAAKAQQLAEKLGSQLLDAGGREILEKLKK
ncbi:MAG: hydroxymethylbilane synthase [Planctomycetota bacterium]|jgi:hydroxymethylbilane synthase